MEGATMTVQRLDSWKQIAAYLNRDQRTAQRWEIQRGLPVHRIPGGLKSAVYAFPNEIEAWLRGKLHRRRPGWQGLLKAGFSLRLLPTASSFAPLSEGFRKTYVYLFLSLSAAFCRVAPLVHIGKIK